MPQHTQHAAVWLTSRHRLRAQSPREALAIAAAIAAASGRLMAVECYETRQGKELARGRAVPTGQAGAAPTRK